MQKKQQKTDNLVSRLYFTAFFHELLSAHVKDCWSWGTKLCSAYANWLYMPAYWPVFWLAFWLHVHQTDLKSSWSVYNVVERFTKQSRAWNLALTFTWLFSILLSKSNAWPKHFKHLIHFGHLILWSGKIGRFRCSNLVRCHDVYHLSPLLWLSILLGSDIGFHLWHVAL